MLWTESFTDKLYIVLMSFSLKHWDSSEGVPRRCEWLLTLVLVMDPEFSCGDGAILNSLGPIPRLPMTDYRLLIILSDMAQFVLTHCLTSMLTPFF
jgi:hypothetical protein